MLPRVLGRPIKSVVGSSCRTVAIQERQMSQIMENFVQPKYFLAYRALVLPQLKQAGLGESHADQIIEQATSACSKAATQEFAPHVLASELALATFEVVSKATSSKEKGIDVAGQTLLAGQLFETSTHKVATMLSWNKNKHAEKVVRDFCKDQKKALDVDYDESTSAMVVRKCFYNDFFRSRGMPEMTKIFCNAERVLFDSATAPKSGLTFDIKQTVADGAERCILKYETSK